MKQYEELVKELDAKIPRDLIATREAAGGRKLSYLEGWYVIDRLNKVLGPGNWAYSADASHVHSGTISSRSGETNSVHYTAKVRLVVTLGDKPTEFTDYGYGDGTDKSNPGKAHELAIKEAVTDGLKRCAKNLGMSFGLALYDKSQENVDDGEDAKQPRPSASVGSPKPTVSTPAAKPEAKVGPAPKNRATVNKLLSQTAKVLTDKKVMTTEQVLQMLDSYGAQTKEDLTDAQANELLTKLQEKLNS